MNGRKPSENISKIPLKTALLFAWRARKGFTQFQAAKDIGVSIQTYHNAEKGRPLQLLKAAKIAKKLRISLEELKQTIS